MSVEDRTEWLMVAGEAFDSMPRGLFMEACQHVGPRVDHPAKISPAILDYAEQNRSDWEWRNRPVTKAPRLAVVKEAPAPKPRPMTQAEVDATPANMIGIGIACGAIVRDADGNLRPAPEEPTP